MSLLWGSISDGDRPNDGLAVNWSRPRNAQKKGTRAFLPRDATLGRSTPRRAMSRSDLLSLALDSEL